MRIGEWTRRWFLAVLVAVGSANLMVAWVACAEDSVHADALDAQAPPDYDPWRPFNERMFFFNHDIMDRYILKPVATGWDKVVPGAAKRGLARSFENMGMPSRFVNNLLQGRVRGAGREVVRFVVNTTVGVAGLLDVAHAQLHFDQSDADTGQTLGVYGIGPGPYLVLPTLPPLTVRDGIGLGVDGFLDPFGFFMPNFATAAIGAVKQVNERALNLETFQDVEDSVLDLYSAVRNGYLQRRGHSIEKACSARKAEWEFLSDTGGRSTQAGSR